MDQLVAKRLGKIIKEERNKQKISIRALAEYCAISHTKLAEIGNGEKLPSKEIGGSICRELDLENNLYKQINEKEEIKQKFNVFLDYVYFQDMDKADQFYQELLLIKERFDLFEIDFELIKLIYYISSNKNKKTIASVIDFLDKNQQYFYLHETVLYFLYKAAYLTDINLLNEAECFLIRASEMTENKKISFFNLCAARYGIYKK